ncbi:MAG: M1 family aminopeptidase [Candidatus Cloacimonas sp.]|jgi:hypothetical protein|nr:M1 family aminopeptidase [Candidatus Cloacimonas sp.]
MKRILTIFGLWAAFVLFCSTAYAMPGWDASASRKYLRPQQELTAPRYEASRADSAHGFDVQKYEITLNIDDATHVVNGNVLATVIAETYLPTITYELSNLTVSSVLVNGTAAPYTHTGGLLNITTNITAGQTFSTQVCYGGTPQLSPNVYHIGMIFGTNTVFTISDPDAGRYWWPSYDHPWDKALVDLHITMRNDWKVAANGLRSNIVDNGNGTSTTHWLGSNPMTTYLVCITAGPYVEINQTVPEHQFGVQNFVMQNQYNNALIDFQNLPAMLHYFSEIFGTYPFEKYGNATVNMSTYGAMEHQTMTTLGNYIITGNQANELTIAHELAHQWYGDAVSFLTFKDVWLSEGFATYSEHLWTDYRFGWQAACNYVASSYHQYYLNWENSSGAQTIYNPAFNNYFAPPSYEKAASVLHMLRLKIGNANFFQLLQQWFATYNGQNVVTSEFQAMAQQISGQDLTQFFNQWIYGSGIPAVEYSVWSTPDISRVKVIAKSTSPTATNFYLEIPFRFEHGTVSDSLLIAASPEGTSNQFLYGADPGECTITPNYNNWTLLRGIDEKRPLLSECLASNGGVLVSWSAFTDGEDSGYLVYRRNVGNQTWTALNNDLLISTSYYDATAQNGVPYEYAYAVADYEGYLSMLSNIMPATPQAFSFSENLLVVDETKDGTGANINPTDAMVDDFYAAALSPMVYSNWDCATAGLPSLAELGNYRLVLWHADDFSQNLLQDNLFALGGYLLGGGKVLLSGWKTASVLDSAFITRFAGAVSLLYDNSASLISTDSATYPSLLVDPAKTTASWNGMLPMIYSFVGAQNPLYTANMAAGSQGNGQCVALRDSANNSFVLLGFPLYFMQAAGVRGFLQQILPELNPALPAYDDVVPLKPASLSSSPNPFNPSTTINYYLPVSGQVSMALYNLKGQKVRSLQAESKSAGNHSLVFNGLDDENRGLASGIYVLRYTHPQGEISKKITLMK